MARLQDIPVETVEAICEALPSKQDYLRLSATCQYFHEAVAPLLWRQVHMLFEQGSHLQESLACALATNAHPAFSHTVRLTIDTPGLTHAGQAVGQLAVWTDRLLLELLHRMRKLKHVEVDFCMSFQPFPGLVNYLYSVQQHLHFLDVTGLYENKLALTAPQALLRGLRIGYTGCHLACNLHTFSTLAHLRLELDCRDGKGHPSHFLNFPSSIWSHLKTFSLETPGMNPTSQEIFSALSISLLNADTVVLEGLAIFWPVEEDDHRQLLAMLSKACPRLRKLAWTLPDCPDPDFNEYLADYLPDLEELTCCVYMHQGAWKWPASIDKYSQGFSQLRNLRVLAVNHYDPEEGGGVQDDSYSGGKYTPECTELAAKGRLKFALEMARKCSKLQNVVFCPTEHERSFVEVIRYGESGQGVAFVSQGPRLFWQGID